MKSNIDCVVIGAGIAGMTAAIYLKRANVNVLLLDKSAPGGQLNKISRIDNYPGFSTISGPDLATNLFEQINSLNIEYRYGNVIDVENNDDYKIVTTETERITTSSVIIATGRQPKKLGLKKEEELVSRGISYCALCDGMFFKDKIVATVGSGNGALNEAIYLSDICKEVIMINKKDTFDGDESIIEKVKNIKNIKIIYNSNVTQFNSKDDILESIIINDKDKLDVSGVFIYTGLEPTNDFLKKLPIKFEKQYIVVDENMQTSIEKIYACGDIVKKSVYQLTTAASDGTIAAINVKKNLK
ncbi:MAG: FAD-dependent oxidoreductase [Bacilli bacterium]|nr:FAD-dependent oxidoreductase [Bacilli bacterium]MDD4607545.1 FAD-dependent oxidoreductase [Bacilli bacterium]